MAVVEHALPSDLDLAWDLEIGRWQETYVTEFEAGKVVERTFWDRPKRTYRGRFTEWALAGGSYNDKLRQWQRFLAHIRNKEDAFYLTEVLTEQHDNVLLGYGDGTRTVFPYPVTGASHDDGTNIIFVDGVPQTSLATIFDANTLSDDCATCTSAAASMAGFGTLVAGTQEWATRDGLTATQIRSVTPSAGHTLPTAERQTASPGEVWVAMLSVIGAGTFTLELLYRDAGGSILGTPASTPATVVTWAAWTDLSISGTAPAHTALADLRFTCTAGGATGYSFDCQGLARGNVARWWLPSVGMSNAILSSAPAAGASVTTSFLGRRIARVRMNETRIESSREAIGDASASFSAIEDWET